MKRTVGLYVARGAGKKILKKSTSLVSLLTIFVSLFLESHSQQGYLSRF